MNKRKKGMWRASLSKVLMVVLVMLAILTVPNPVAKAAATPTLNKTSRNILIGATYNLNVNNKVKNATYSWTSDNKSVATVDQRGIVKGVKKGTAVITCEVKAPSKSYQLECKINVIKPASSFAIKNKVTALNLGQSYDINRILTPSTSNDKTTWSSSDKSIAAPNSNGIFTAKKQGTVTITGKTLSGKSDSMTILVVDKEGTVTNQEELTTLIGSGVKQITIKTKEVGDLTIPSGDYSNTSLIVDAPNAVIYNNGVFASIEIRQLAADSWYENTKGNQIKLLAADTRIVITPNGVVKLELDKADANIKIENNGVIEEAIIKNAAKVYFTGSSAVNTPITVWSENLLLSTSTPLDLNLNKKIQLTLRKGSEASKIQVASQEVIPSITGNSKVVVQVGTGSTASTQEIVPTPLPAEPTTGGGFGGGIGGGAGGGTGGGTTPDVTKIVNQDGSVDYRLSRPYTDLASIQVTYRTNTQTISGGTLATLKLFLADDPLAILMWKNMSGINSFGGYEVNVEGASGSTTKTLTVVGGPQDGRSFQVSVPGNGTVAITNLPNGTIYTISKIDDKTLRTNANNEEVTFHLTFN